MVHPSKSFSDLNSNAAHNAARRASISNEVGIRPVLPAVYRRDSVPSQPTLQQDKFAGQSSSSSLFPHGYRKYSQLSHLTADSMDQGSTSTMTQKHDVASSTASFQPPSKISQSKIDSKISPLTLVKTSKRSRVFSTFFLLLRPLHWIQEKIPLFARLLCLIVPLLIMVLALGSYLVIDSAIASSNAARADNLAFLSHELNTFQVALEKERTSVLGSIQANSTGFIRYARFQMANTDQTYETFAARLASVGTLPKADLDPVLNMYDSIPQTRDAFYEDLSHLGKSQALSKAISFYSSITSAIEGLSAAISSRVSDELGASASSAALMDRRREILDLQSCWTSKSSLLTLALVRRTWNSTQSQDNAAYRTWLLYHQRDALESSILSHFQTSFPDTQWKSFSDEYNTIRSPIRNFENQVLDIRNLNQVQGNLLYWIRNTTSVLNIVEKLEMDTLNQILDNNRAMYSQSMTQTIVIIALFVFFMPCIIMTSGLFCISIYRPVMEQKRDLVTALDIADSIMNLRFDSPGVLSLKEKSDSQCTNLELAFKKILSNFESFMPYVPRHLLMRDDEEEDVKNELSNAHSHSNVSRSSSRRLSLSRMHSKATTLSAGSRRLSHSSRSSSRRDASFSTIQKKHVSFMVVDLNDFCRSSFEMSFDQLQHVYAQYLTLISQMLKKTHGLMHSFSGGIFICSWGAVGRHFELPLKAATSALQVLEYTQSDPNLPFNVSIGISSGVCAVGELGNSEQRGLNVIGTPLTMALALSKLARKYRCGILSDAATYKEANFNFEMKQMDSLHFQKSCGADILKDSIFQLVADKKVVADEWMYELENARQKDVYASFNSAWEDVIEGNFTQARQKLEEFKQLQKNKSDASDSDEEEKDEDSQEKKGKHKQTSGETSPALDTRFLESIIEHGEEDSRFRYHAVSQQWKAENNMD